MKPTEVEIERLARIMAKRAKLDPDGTMITSEPWKFFTGSGEFFVVPKDSLRPLWRAYYTDAFNALFIAYEQIAEKAAADSARGDHE